jgi:hypothetical protein
MGDMMGVMAGEMAMWDGSDDGKWQLLLLALLERP